jgi:hypothetical protein
MTIFQVRPLAKSPLLRVQINVNRQKERPGWLLLHLPSLDTQVPTAATTTATTTTATPQDKNAQNNAKRNDFELARGRTWNLLIAAKCIVVKRLAIGPQVLMILY